MVSTVTMLALFSSSVGLCRELGTTTTGFGSHPCLRSLQRERDKIVHLWIEAIAPERNQNVRRKSLWVDGWSTPACAKARLTVISQRRLQSCVSCLTRDWYQDTAQGNGNAQVHSARTTSEAIFVLKNHLQRGITPDPYTYVKVLQLCLKHKDLVAVKQVHDFISKTRMEERSYVASTLLNAYVKCGQLLDARQVFDKLEKKDVVTWNMMIAGYAKSGRTESALELFKSMRQQGVQPNDITYLCALKACASSSTLEWGKELHVCIRNGGFESDVRVATALVQMYAKCGCITEARQVFDGMKRRNLITWNTMISGLAQDGFGHEAYRLYMRMRREGFEPDAYTYASIFSGSASEGALEWMKKVHGHCSKAGLESDLHVASALVHMYCKNGSIDNARMVFDRMERRNLITWNTMIGGLSQDGCGHEAYRLYMRMRREGFEPDAYTYASIFSASASEGALEWVKDVHGHASVAGLDSDLRVGTALVHMYAKCGRIDEARMVFDRMEKRDVATWSVMIGGLAHHGRGHGAYRLFLQMKQQGFEPDAYTYASIFNASASAGALEWVKEVHGHASNAGLDSDLRVASALVHMYAKSGSIDDARTVFGRMEKRDVFAWNIMIGGLAQHGCGHEAVELFRKMHVNGVKPDAISFAAVLSACSNVGLVEEGRALFSAMKEDYGIEPDVVHYTSVVDLLGRAGHLEDAKLFVSDMPLEPVAATWMALLGACRTYGDVELGELAAKALFKLEPNNAAGYVVLSNIYAAAGKWEKVSMVRSIMQEIGVKKEPGRSWIEVDNKIHEFVVGDVCHPEAEAIYTYLNKLTEKLKTEGYTPDTRLVLQDIDEEEKELALCSHSEKLAITYGLMHTPVTKPIRVFKNLRVCSDCHTATKLISKVTGREIIARDANRFHHIKNGMCSCGDYW